MFREQDIHAFFKGRDLDIRKTGNARWIDQKCAADVVSIIADCIINYVSTNEAASQLLEQNATDEMEMHHLEQSETDEMDMHHLEQSAANESEGDDAGKVLEFNSRDIWFSNYTVTYVQDIFKKPDLNKQAAKHEYDKFFMQPMEMLAYAGVLNKRKVGTRNIYSVADYEVLEYISLRERNALAFLQIYIQKVLSDSGLWDVFDTFYEKQTADSYKAAKLAFSSFTKEHTPINGDTECNRIFIKVLNPIAYVRNSKGTERGHLSANKITYDMLMYNRNNFRDVYSGKAKEMTRKESAALQGTKTPNDSYYRYQAQKAKNFLRVFIRQVYNGMPEHREEGHINDLATHMHHIFPEAQYPQISFFLENLIALTPTQHLNYAHPNGSTSEINRDYQYHLLISKAQRIKENIETCNDFFDVIYDFHRFVYVLSVGFDKNELNEQIPLMDWPAVASAINSYYDKTKLDADPALSLYQSFQRQ